MLRKSLLVLLYYFIQILWYIQSHIMIYSQQGIILAQGPRSWGDYDVSYLYI